MALKEQKKFYPDLELIEAIEIYSKTNRKSFSDSVIDLCKKGLLIDGVTKNEIEILKEVKDCKSNLVYMKSLLKQTYADLNLTFNDIKTSKNLKKFDDNFKRRKIDD